MFMLKAQRRSAPETLDDLFLKHYAALIARARQLVGPNRHAAEDLVHDVYVRLALRHLDLSAVQNLDGYLFTTLRNVHLSQVRRRMVTVAATVSIVDYESAVSGLRNVTDEEQRQAALEALTNVVRYACLRKVTSRAASVLILRFLHGYYPSEIARVVRATEAAVSERLRMARAEARAYLADPGRVRPFTTRHAPLHVDRHGQDDAAYVRALRQPIFDTCAGRCLSVHALDRLYADQTSASPDVTMLAHLVSCAACLDTVNRRLGLPLLAERDVADNLGRGGPANGNGPGPGNGNGHGRGTAGRPDLRSVLRTRLDETREDHPQELQIAVNGLFVGAQAVHGAMSEQRLKILITEQVGFLEIFDEHGICLLYLDVEPPPHGPVEQTARVALSGSRQLHATLAFSDASPTLHVVYDNPAQDPSLEDDRQVVPEHAQGRWRAMEAPPDAPHPMKTWSLWPVGLRFVIAGIILGVLLANPTQTLAAADQMRRAIVGSLTRLFGGMRPQAAVPSPSMFRPVDIAPLGSLVAPIASMRKAAPNEVSDLDLSAMTLKALSLLDGAGALTMEQISVARGADHRVHIAGVVDTEARRRELLAALRPLPAQRIRVDLLTLDSAARRLGRTPSSASALLRSAELTTDRVPAAYEQARRWVVAQKTAGATPTTHLADATVSNTVRQTAAALLARSLQARVHGRTVRELVTSVSPADASRLPSSALGTWREMVTRHAELFRDETASLRRELEQIFPLPAQNDGAAVATNAPDDDPWHIAARLFTLASAHDVAVRRAFAVAADGHESLEAGTPAFQRSLREAERLTTALLEAMQGAPR